MRLGGKTRALDGERVQLRRHDPKNYGLYAEWYGDPEIWHLTSWAKTPLGRSSVKRLFEERELSTTDDSFAIHLNGEDKPVGVISLMGVSEANLSADLSVIVGAPDDRSHGYGAEAIKMIVRYAFEDLGLNRVGLSVFEFNESAISAYERLGFEHEGRLRRAVKRADGFHDALLMSVLRDEWTPPRGF
ncbi:MAG TPA: GNAT family protein [Rubrobacter sp.]|nr:GNAT family protein [Rubrobacter sp.]